MGKVGGVMRSRFDQDGATRRSRLHGRLSSLLHRGFVLPKGYDIDYIGNPFGERTVHIMEKKSDKRIGAAQILEKGEPEWARKQKLALEARSFGEKIRDGKQKSFRMAVGRARF